MVLSNYIGVEKESSIDKGKILLEQYFIGGSVSRCKHILAQGAKGVCEMSLSQPLVISAINRRNYMYDSHSTMPLFIDMAMLGPLN